MKNDPQVKDLGKEDNDSKVKGAKKYKLRKSCWKKVREHLKENVGAAEFEFEDGPKMETSEYAAKKEGSNPFPELEIDEMRELKLSELTQFVKELERRTEIAKKVQSNS